MREEWERVRSAAIVARAEAVRARAWAQAHRLDHMCEQADLALHSVVTALFGLPPRPESPLWEALLRSAEQVTAEQVADAQRVWRDYVRARDAERAARKAAQAAQAAQAREAERAERRARMEAARAELPPVGAVIEVARPYRLARETRGLAVYEGRYVSVPGLIEQGTYRVRVTRHINTRLYGRPILMEGEQC